MAELQGKGRRLTGMFAVMIGGGLLLESAATRTGALLLAIGLGLFAWGFVPSGATRRSAPEDRA